MNGIKPANQGRVLNEELTIAALLEDQDVVELLHS